MDYSIFYPYRGIDVKIEGGPLIMIFPEVEFLSQGIFFQGYICTIIFFGVGD